MTDSLHTPGAVLLRCDTPGCNWCEWRDPLSQDIVLAERGEFRCGFCSDDDERLPPDAPVSKARMTRWLTEWGQALARFVTATKSEFPDG